MGEASRKSLNLDCTSEMTLLCYGKVLAAGGKATGWDTEETRRIKEKEAEKPGDENERREEKRKQPEETFYCVPQPSLSPTAAQRCKYTKFRNLRAAGVRELFELKVC